MLSGVWNSPVAIQVNINIMRAFVAIRRLAANLPAGSNPHPEKEVRELREYMEQVFAGHNGISEGTGLQPELINRTLAGLQADRKLSNRPRRSIGFVRPAEDGGE